jgi:hypothetical protein
MRVRVRVTVGLTADAGPGIGPTALPHTSRRLAGDQYRLASNPPVESLFVQAHLSCPRPHL